MVKTYKNERKTQDKKNSFYQRHTSHKNDSQGKLKQFKEKKT